MNIKLISSDIKDRLKMIRLLLLDVDGVLTDGSIIYDDDGRQIKGFNVKDGLGIRLLMDAGIKVGIVTGRRSNVLNHRCKNLGIKYLFDNIRDKAAILGTISDETGVPPDHTAFIGDDIIDVPLMKKVGLSIAVSDASNDVKNNAHYATSSRGGCGAVREVCEMILKARGLWREIEERFSL